MAINPYISQNHRQQQSLYEDLVIEAISFYGQDVYYLPREIVNLDKVLLDDVPSRFSEAYKIEMYIENTDGFDGEGNLFTKFGIELRDQATFVVARRRWRNMIGDKLDGNQFRPREGDLIYLPLSQSIFEIREVKTESPFYQLSQLPLFRMQCELFEYNDEDFDTMIDEIDVVEREHAFQYVMTMQDLANHIAQIEAEIDDNGSITNVNIIDGGQGYVLPPSVTIGSHGENFGYFGPASLSPYNGQGVDVLYDVISDHGSTEFFFLAYNPPSAGEYHAMFVTGGDSVNNANKRYVFGYDSLGNIVYSALSNGGVGVVTTQATFPIDGRGWHHFAIFVEDQTAKIYIDGDLKDTLVFPETQQFISAEGAKIGTNAAGTYDGVTFNAMAGWIDEYRAQAGIFAQILDNRVSLAGLLSVPTVEHVSDSLTAYLNHFDGEDAVIELIVDQGVVVGANIVNPGHLYSVTPTLTVDEPGIRGFYGTGDEVYQQFDGYQLKGEVAAWNSETLELTVVHTGATDGNYHEWSVGVPVMGDGAAWLPISIESVDNNQPVQDNQVFDDFAADFIDFSESNPFGEI